MAKGLGRLAIAMTIALFLVWSLAVTEASDLLGLARDGQSDYRVAIAQDAEQPIPAATQEFVHFFEKITGVTLPIVTDDQPMSDREIIIGPSQHLDNLATYIDWDTLGREGYVIRTVGDHLLLFGGPGRGTINAVYTFLDEHLGCHWYTPTFNVIPRNPGLAIDVIHVENVPDFESRAMSCINAADPAWASRNRINSFNASMGWGLPSCDFTNVNKFLADPRLTNTLKFAMNTVSYRSGYAPTWVHTLAENQLLPAKYFKEHPEYFGLDEHGKRNVEITPCLTNPNVLDIVVESARKWLRQTPGANIISISQADQPQYDFCHCTNCTIAGKTFTYKLTTNPLGVFPYAKLPSWTNPELLRPTWDPATSETQSPVRATGVLLEFLNRLATNVESDHPHIFIHTLAYYWTKYPPDDIKLDPNVIVDFAPLNACHYHTFADCSYNEGFKGLWTAIRRWTQASSHTWVWLYDSRTPMDPRPTLDHLSLQLNELAMAGVAGVYMFTYEFRRYSWLNDLRSYLFAKLLWNPEYDMAKGTQEFADAYYGRAAQPILAYVRSTQESENYVSSERDKIMSNFSGFHDNNWTP